MKKIIIISIILSYCFLGYSQDNYIEKRFNKIQLELSNKYPEISKGQFEITIFGNNKCTKCSQLINTLETNQIQFIEFDLRIHRNANLMRKLCYKKANSTSISIKYPIVLINNKVFFEIEDINKFSEEIIKQYKHEKTTYINN